MLTRPYEYFFIASFIAGVNATSLKNVLVADYDETLRPGFYEGN